MRWKADRQVDFAPAYLPEFDLEVSWAMCRNPMCPNFGLFFRGRILETGTATSDEDNLAFRADLLAPALENIHEALLGGEKIP